MLLWTRRYLQDYYFISTSSPGNLHNLEGGYCKTHNMKVVFKVPRGVKGCQSYWLQVSQNVASDRSESSARGESIAGSKNGPEKAKKSKGERASSTSSLSSKIESAPIVLILSFVVKK